MMAIKQKKHFRVSSKGKKFSAGKRKKPLMKRKKSGPCDGISIGMKKEVMKEHFFNLKKELKQNGRVKIPDVGILKIKIKKAVKGGQERKNPLTGGTYITKDKPRRKVVKFTAMKSLKEAI